MVVVCISPVLSEVYGEVMKIVTGKAKCKTSASRLNIRSEGTVETLCTEEV